MSKEAPDPKTVLLKVLADHEVAVPWAAGPVGVAISGGGDSTALLVLTVELLGADQVRAATVDHGLRPEAAAEARRVGALCARLGVDHEVLVWDGAPKGNLMAAARAARHRLLTEWALRHDLMAILLGHTRDDQAETFLMNLQRGSGVDGLAAMPEAREEARFTWLRPLLEVPRAALRDELRKRGLQWEEDPTNDDPRFLRTRIRHARVVLAELGITDSVLAATAGRMARARVALEMAEREARSLYLREDRGMALVLNKALALPLEVRDRFFSGLIHALSGAAYPPRLAALQATLKPSWPPGARGYSVLGGVCLERQADAIRLWREFKAVAGLRVPANAVWDGRWSAEGPDAEGAEIAAMGEAGLTQLSRQAAEGLHPHWRKTGLEAYVLKSLPGIWQGGALIAAPLALWPEGWRLVARPLAAPPQKAAESD